MIILKHVHGGIIPRNQHFEEKFTVSLLEFEPGDKVTIKRVRDKTELLVYLSSKNISIGNDVEIVTKDETNKVMILKRNDIVTILSYDNAMNILQSMFKSDNKISNKGFNNTFYWRFLNEFIKL